jgi:hypothetical protein
MDSTISAERQHYSVTYYSVTYGIESKIAHAEGFNITEELPEHIMHVVLEGIAPARLLLVREQIPHLQFTIEQHFCCSIRRY